jgi:hypothetical protein
MWDGFEGDKLAYLAMMASDANHELSGDWLEGWLRTEIARRRRANPGQNAAETTHAAMRGSDNGHA